MGYLNFRKNLFQGIQSEKHLANLTSLVELDASSNLQLTMQVSSNRSFQLKRLFLGSCFIGAQFPTWFQTQELLLSQHVLCRNLRCHPSFVLDTILWYCRFISQPNHGLHSTYMHLASNNFTGPLPISLPV